MWNDLTMSERAGVIKMAVKAGLRDMKSIRKFYNDSLKYADGGPKATYGKPYYSYDKNMQIETDNGKPILNYNATLPEVNIIPDSKKSPADRNADERFRRKTFSDYDEHKDREYTQRQIMRSQRDWDNSLEKKALGYAQDAMTGIGIGADIVSGYPVYSSLKGSRVLSEANSLPEYIEGGLWLAPIGGVVGKEAYNVSKNVWSTSKNTTKSTIENIGKNSKTTPIDFNNLTLEQWTPEQWTAEQDAAIAKGDMAEAQRLRDLHFKVNTPGNVVVKNGTPTHNYHGTYSEFNTFDINLFGRTDYGDRGRGFYFSQDKGVSEGYGPNIKDVYLYAKTPYKGVGKEKYLGRGKTKDEVVQYLIGLRRKSVEEDVKHMIKQQKNNTHSPMYDSLGITDDMSEQEIRNRIYKTYGREDTIPYEVGNLDEADVFLSPYENVVYKPNQIKLADAVTYNDNGIRIPLGLRDNFKSKDIRYGLIPIIGGAALSNKKAEGGSIHIAPSKRGTFTAAATKHGMGVQEFASKVLANKDNYSPAMVKKANFAKNASKWQHGLGGYLFESGGPKSTNREYKSANSWGTANVGKALAPILEPISRKIMNMGENWAFPSDFEDGADLSKSTAQDTYLLPRNVQRAVFLNRGYNTAPKDYGLVEKAVNRRNIPVYQKAPDDISRDKVVPMLNVMAEDTITETENWFGRPNAKLEDPGSFPTTFYISTDGKKIYQKGWDLNDYEDTTGRWYQSKLKRAAAKGIDLVGNPTVVTTGISEVGNLTDLYKEYPELVEDILASKGLVLLFNVNAEEEPLYTKDGELIGVTHKSGYVPSLPEVTITGKRRKKVK